MRGGVEKPTPRWLWATSALLGPGPWLLLAGAYLFRRDYPEDFFVCSINPHRADITSSLMVVAIWLAVFLCLSLLALALRVNVLKPAGLGLIGGASVAAGVLLILVPAFSQDYNLRWDGACRNSGYTYNIFGFSAEPAKGH